MSSFSDPFLRHDIISQDDEKITFKVEKEMKEHFYDVASLLYFGPPHNKIVSCSADQTIRIWSSKTYECLKTISLKVDIYNANHIRDLLKLTDTVFLSCSRITAVRSFNISTPNFDRDKEVRLDGYHFLELLRLTDDLFVGRTFSEEIIVYSYSEEKVLKKFVVQNLFQYSNRHLLRSQNFPKCFYVATMDEHETIFLIDYEKEVVVKEFKSHNKKRIWSLCLFINSKNEEILIAGHTARTIYTYNTSHPQFDTRKKIVHIKRRSKSKAYNYNKDLLHSCFGFDNQTGFFLLFGDNEGSVHLFEFHEPQGSIKKMKEQKIHKSWVHEVLLLPDLQIILSCSDDSNVTVSRVGGLSKKTNYDVLDGQERFEFLLEYMKVRTEFCIRVLILQIGDTIEIVVPKTLFV